MTNQITVEIHGGFQSTNSRERTSFVCQNDGDLGRSSGYVGILLGCPGSHCRLPQAVLVGLEGLDSEPGFRPCEDSAV